MEQFGYDYKVMIVAEKPSISKAIAGYLQKRSPWDYKLIDFDEESTCVQKVYGEFRGLPTKFIVTSTKGKLYTYDFFDNRRNTDPINCFDKDIKKCPINEELNDLLSDYAEDSDFLILWLDNDDAGENICFEVIETVENRLRKGCEIIRTQIQSVDKISIGKALKEAEVSGRRPNEFISESVDTKHILDLRIGVAFTQMQTQYCRKKRIAFPSESVSYGPCQTPTLYLVAERDLEIRAHDTDPKYQISCYVKVDNVEYKAIINETIDTREDAQVILDEVSQDNHFRVVNTQIIAEQLPLLSPLNTIEYLKACSEQFNIGAEDALNIAQDLYGKGYITYPRTENNRYSKTTDIDFERLKKGAEGDTRDMIKEAKLCKIPDELISDQLVDHDPIIPTGVVPDPRNTNLSKQDYKIYWFIVRHTMATIILNIKRQNYKIKIIHQQSDKQFTMLGQHQESFKYEKYFPQLALQQQRISTRLFNDNTVFQSTKTEMEKVPSPMLISESELLSKMENNGIGTDASQASHIQMIINRGYAKVNSDRKLTTTSFGMQIIEGYLEVDPDLVKPTLRSEMEEQTKKIATQKSTASQVKEDQLSKYKAKFIEVEQRLDEIFLNHARGQYQQ